jgi:hypothetical protein
MVIFYSKTNSDLQSLEVKSSSLIFDLWVFYVSKIISISAYELSYHISNNLVD